MAIEILYVDDEPSLLEICKEFLETRGDITVDTIGSGQAALRRMAEKRYDAIISDYQMPTMDGITLLKTIRANRDDIPFILFTGRGREEVAIDALNNGADAYIQKGGTPSVQFTVLRHRIKQAVDRHRAEVALRRNEERFRSYVEGAHVAMIICQSGRVTFANHRSLEMFRFANVEEMLGKNLEDLIAPQDRNKTNIKQHLLEATDVSDYDTDMVGLRNDGTIVQLHVILSNVWTPWESAPAILLMLIDISRQHETERTLREAQRIYSTVLNDTHVGIATIDEDGTPLDANDEFLKMLGYEREEFKAKKFSDITPPSDLAKSNELLKLIKCGDIDSYELEKRFICKDGFYHWAKVSVSRVITDSGRLQRIVLVTDINARKGRELAMSGNLRSTIHSGLHSGELNGMMHPLGEIIVQQRGPDPR